ncbi:MAG: hypothetical protein NTZ65_00510 [Candidatus Berkelbacteria bacterium]|nr:hypothetical protein [Candidatus Berkelbacteria bacterium]
MKNWSTSLAKFDKKDQKYQVWRLEQLINFGIGNGKISQKLFKKYYDELDIDKDKKKYLIFLLNLK